jgi:hypothetical protein
LPRAATAAAPDSSRLIEPNRFVYNTVWAAAAAAFPRTGLWYRDEGQHGLGEQIHSGLFPRNVVVQSRRVDAEFGGKITHLHVMYTDPSRQLMQGRYYLGSIEFCIGSPYPSWHCDTFTRGRHKSFLTRLDLG